MPAYLPLVVALLCLLGGIGIGVEAERWRVRRTVRRVEPQPEKTPVPPTVADDGTGIELMVRFGKPEVVLYRREEWEEPLRCNGECQLPEFALGQAIWLVPINDGTGQLPYCLDCAVVPAGVDA